MAFGFPQQMPGLPVRNRAEIKELREQLQTLSLTVQKLAGDVEKLTELMTAGLRHVSKREKGECEKMMLMLENHLLRFERRLPPANSGGDAQ
jgi:hypothetical protein